MPQLLAQTDAETLLLMHPVWPFFMAATVLGWAYLIERLDKDAGYFYMPRYWLNLAHLVVGGVAFVLMLLLPYFFLGLLLGLLLIVGNIVAYGYYHNSQVPAAERWDFSLQQFTQRLEQRQHAKAQRAAKMMLFDSNGAPLDVPTGEDAEVPAHETTEDVAEFAFERGAEAIELAVDSERAIVCVRVDGVRYSFPEQVSPQVAMQVVDYLKDAAGMDVSDRRKRQVGQLSIAGGECGRHELELETSGSTRGLTMNIDIDATNRASVPLDDLGLIESQRQQVDQFFDNEPNRVVIVAGPRRQGVSTTLYSLLQHHDPYTQSVVTLEERVLSECEGVNHTELGEGASAEQFNNKLSGLMRGDPHVIMLSHLADEQSAKLVANAATDLRVYFPLVEEDTFSALRSWIALVGDAEKAANALGLIITQRLVRKLCMTCRVAYKPDAAALKKLNLPPDKVSKLYRASGKNPAKEDSSPCEDCHGLGYRGRIAVFEVMHLDDTARGYLAKGETQQLRGHLRKQRMLWMQEAALHRVVQGVTDIKEITRVLGGGRGRR